jgi:hypothetical protein
MMRRGSVLALTGNASDANQCHSFYRNWHAPVRRLGLRRLGAASAKRCCLARGLADRLDNSAQLV